MQRSIAKLTAIVLLVCVGCSSVRPRFRAEAQDVRNLRTKLAVLREGMSRDEVQRILGVTLFAEGWSLNFPVYVYPSPFERRRDYSLSCAFYLHGTNETLMNATLNLHETWPK